MYMLSPMIDLSAFIFPNSFTVVNDYDCETDLENFVPNGVTLYQPSSEH